MKILFFSDFHGNKYVLPGLVKLIDKIKPDQIVFCGDIFGYYYYYDEVIDFLKLNNVLCIKGNHDQIAIDLFYGNLDEELIINKYGNVYRDLKNKLTKKNLDFIEGLKDHLVIKLDSISIGVFHGSPENALNGRVYPDTVISNTEIYNKFDLVILGHTHHKMVRKIGNSLVINPGSIGQQRDGKGCTALLFNSEFFDFQFIEIAYDKTHLINDIMMYDKERFDNFSNVLNRNAAID